MPVEEVPREKVAPASCCSPKPTLGERGPLTPEQAGDLEAVFKVLANDTRLRLLHALVLAEELCVSELAERLGMKPQAISNQLTRLGDLRVLGSRREGNNVYYRILDPCVVSLLDQGLCLMEDAKVRQV